MGFPGTWMTESESMVYRVVPKCACSTIGQIMFYSDHGTFFDGDISFVLIECLVGDWQVLMLTLNKDWYM